MRYSIPNSLREDLKAGIEAILEYIEQPNLSSVDRDEIIEQAAFVINEMQDLEEEEEV